MYNCSAPPLTFIQECVFKCVKHTKTLRNRSEWGEGPHFAQVEKKVKHSKYKDCGFQGHHAHI